MNPSVSQAGTVVDRYTIEAPIGEGGMATVYRVRHNTLGTLHALKVLTVSSPSLRDRLRQEGRLQAMLEHPNVVSVTDVIAFGDSDGLIMEYVDGPSLEALMRQQRLSLERVDELATGLFAGVAQAHALGYVHRDLKPANILLQETPQGYVAKITDFGLAKVFRESSGSGRIQTRTGTTMGTPQYMSPEQIRDSKHVGPRADIFSLGAILYEMLSGQRAFDGEDVLEIFNAVANGRYRPIRSAVPEVPERMERAIQAALQIDPNLRPDSVQALASIWSGAMSAEPIPEGPRPEGPAMDPFATTVWVQRSSPTVAIDPPSEIHAPDATTESVPEPAPSAAALDPDAPTASEPVAAEPAPSASKPPRSIERGPGWSSVSVVWPAWVVGLGGGMAAAGLVVLLVVLIAVGEAWYWMQAEEVVPVLELPAGSD